MITSKAIAKVLAGIAKYERDFCYSDDPECECELEHDVRTGPPTHGITYVTDRGDLDKAINREVWGAAWGSCGDLAEALDQPTEFPADRDILVVIDRATGDWQAANSYFD